MKNILLKILTYFAKLILRNKKPLIIAITGSAGKTTTKEAIYTVLKSEPKFSRAVWQSFGNLNTEFGIPLAVAGMKVNEPQKYHWIYIIPWMKLRILAILLGIIKYPKIIILELAADKPGDIKWLTSYIKPKIVVVTSVGPAHLKNYISIDDIAQEKSILISSCLEHGWVILNKRDEFYSFMAEKVPEYCQLITVDVPPEISYIDYSRAVGKYFGIKMSDVDSALKKFKHPQGRMDIIKLKNNITLIDSSYNSNPLSLRVALSNVDKLKREIRPKRIIGIIGDMLELGDHSEKFHRELTNHLKISLDYIVSVGNFSRMFNADKHFATVEEAIDFVLKEIHPNDMILVKGSHGIRLDKIVVEIINNRNKLSENRNE
ncbi:MAG: UDP-N-acetylmuramoyl-tripeptide--D-alanyl-D-alanine ligase [Candidatus Berkelbacteria bacterium Licking1014_85]|uniref:UDP-N-acetylmuramoyl-tripeptide--D-alanyl-D-alanine ligase n=1 Tax=Candidatus Berkelbacteria bacterium Licking1014_85 TaxID=2017148 RepID=A0A554LL49_9BACT|nr:MAG: UDP-N-acetylmuramoyl-tripeptide--D-alanyl-D-alanine ligase [Candidatus Berkelbacteria bacterium Licking1014_85]